MLDGFTVHTFYARFLWTYFSLVIVMERIKFYCNGFVTLAKRKVDDLSFPMNLKSYI